MDVAGQGPVKLQVLWSIMMWIDGELHYISGEVAIDTAVDLPMYFGCAIPKHIEIHPP